jgi:allantoicase
LQSLQTGLQDTPLLDWAVLKLGCGGASNTGISRIIVDTRHFKGNFPESCKIDGCSSSLSDEAISNDSSVEWFPILNRVALVADAEHEFLREAGLIENGTRRVTHVRISIYPDGGLSRVRVYGEPFEVEKVPLSHL